MGRPTKGGENSMTDSRVITVLGCAKVTCHPLKMERERAERVASSQLTSLTPEREGKNLLSDV